jgi:ubiquinone/menaquinone biosynthesis C-methylase UbiE
MAKTFSSGEGYEGMMGRHSRKLAPLFADFAVVRDRGSILDVGCGTGSLTQVLVERTHEARIVGVDPSKGFVEHAGKRFAGNSRVTIEEGSATALPHAAKSFNQTLTLLVLMFIADAEKALSELVRVTRPRGTVAACVWHQTGMQMGTLFREEALKLDPEGGRDKFGGSAHPYDTGQLTHECHEQLARAVVFGGKEVVAGGRFPELELA